jgi:hypothetical protein
LLITGWAKTPEEKPLKGGKIKGKFPSGSKFLATKYTTPSIRNPKAPELGFSRSSLDKVASATDGVTFRNFPHICLLAAQMVWTTVRKISELGSYST